MIDKQLLEAMALRSEIYENLDRLRQELEQVKDSEDPKEQEKAQFFEELGLRFFASLEAGLDPAIAGVAATAWINKGGCGEDDCPHCVEGDTSEQVTDRLLEMMEEAKKSGFPLFVLPGDDTIH